MKFRYLAPALLGAVALTLSGCAEAPDAGTPATSTAPTTTASVPASTEPTGDFKACMVSDEGGFDDKSFNQTSYEGVLKAEKELGVTKAQVQSANAADYTRNVQSMVDADCDIVIGVGFALTDAVVASAKANPDVWFIGVDQAPLCIDEQGNLKQSAIDEVEGMLKRQFRPEFLNRLDDIVYYKSLTKQEIGSIVDLMLEDLRRRLADKQLKLAVTDAAKAAIIDGGYDPIYGARPLKRYIQANVETRIAKEIIAGSHAAGDTLTVDAEGGSLVLR